MSHDPAVVPVTCKLPASVVEGLEDLAREQNLSRSAVLRELAEAAVQGRVERPIDELRGSRRRADFAARLREDVRLSEELGIARTPLGARWGVRQVMYTAALHRAGADPLD